jgi:ATP-dependent DNA helicase RecQ
MNLSLFELILKIKVQKFFLGLLQFKRCRMTTQNLILLTSPPASGKTYWITSLKEALPDSSILVISPLRALADECQDKWQGSILVMTPEEWLGKKTYCDIVILDEFHLFFYWGDSFRPLMWECFYELSANSQLVFALTATLSQLMKKEVEYVKTQFVSLTRNDLGHQILKYQTPSYVKCPDKKWILDLLFSEKKNQDVKLIFCQFREEVFQLERLLTEKGFKCISCVGGESKFMAQKLKINPCPDYIISTTVLSHGVNLPKLEKIFFTYKVSNIDFWIQMVARGGRKGEAYKVYALEKPFVLPWSQWKNLCQLGFLWLKLKLSVEFCLAAK